MAGLLVCPLCGGRSQGFTSLQALLVSLLQAVSRPLACPVCPDSLAGLDKFTLHLLAHAVPLAQTGIVFSETPTFTPSPVILQTGQTPLIEFTPEEPRLTNVELSSASFTQVVVEKETSVQPKEEPVCPLCQLTLADPSLLPMHMQLVHRGESAEGRFACQLCPKSFKMRGTLIVHRKVAHPTTGEETTPDEGNGKDDKTSGTKKEASKPWQCEECQKHFTTKYFLKKHRRLHTGEMPYQCNICLKSFTFQQSYHKHLLYHRDEKPHKCPECDKSFKELSTLHNHQRIHTGEKPFACDTCGKCFRQRVSYLVHRRIHTGVMPYQCTACLKSFRYKVSQRTHKCPAQPPGSVVRHPSPLVEKLKQQLHPHIDEQPQQKSQVQSVISDDQHLSTSPKTEQQPPQLEAELPEEHQINQQQLNQTQPAIQIQQEISDTGSSALPSDLGCVSLEDMLRSPSAPSVDHEPSMETINQDFLRHLLGQLPPPNGTS